MRRRGWLAAVLVLLLPLAGASAPRDAPNATLGAASAPNATLGASKAPDATSSSNWVGSWATAPVQEDGGQWQLENQSLRMIAHLSLGGPRLRVRLSNAYGSAPVTFGQVRVARRTAGPAVDPATDRPVRFGGLRQVSIPAGQDAVSDPVDLPVVAGSDLAVSMHVRSARGGATRHPLALTTQYASPHGSGDVTRDASGSGFTSPMSTTYFLTGVDVQASARASAVVAFGDSITDGSSSIPDSNGRWPDFLARRLATAGMPHVGVLNAGISANTVTRSGDRFGGGEPGVVRFGRDVLAQSGVHAVVVFEGTNDLAAGVPAAEVVSGLRALAQRARAAGLTVVGATILPRACGGTWSARAELHRLAVNAWVRSAREFAAVADLDAALRNPQQPTCLHPRYDSGDGLHPNQDGMRRIADAVPLRALAP